MTDFKEKCIREVQTIAEQINELGISDNYEELDKYFDDVLDVEYRIASDGSYKGVYIYLSLGGPNIWVDTMSRTVELRWGTDLASALLCDEAIVRIDEKFEELYRCIRENS